MARDLVEALYRETQSVSEYLAAQGQPSFQAAIEDSARKLLIIAAASYFEASLTETVQGYVVSELDCEDHPLFKVVRTRAIERQYHTWFDWKIRHAGPFFAMFGDRFKAFMKESVDKDAELQTAIEAFIEVGALRNNLVHQNLADFTVEKTPKEIYDLYKAALPFVGRIGGFLAEFTETL